MKNHRRTPPLWRAWVEMQLDTPAAARMLDERELAVDFVRQIASAEAGLARFGTVHVETPVLADLLQVPVEQVMRARLALVHLKVVVFTRADDGTLVRDLDLPLVLRPGKKLPPALEVALERLQPDEWDR